MAATALLLRFGAPVMGVLLAAASGSAWADALVALDVGHSHLHPGVISARGKPEFEFNVALARVVHDTLLDQHVASLLIGDDGNMVELPARSRAAGAAGASFLLSIHHDSAQAKYFHGWEWQGAPQLYADDFSGYSLFVSRKNPQLAQSLLCARQLGLALQQIGLHASPHHAEAIPGESREWADQAAGVYYYDDLVVLRTATMPAVLLEAGVIVNRSDELHLRDSAQQHAMALALLQGLSNCNALPAAHWQHIQAR